ncbi:MAG: hypothetical protein HQL96_01310 [Magnetococcales bacterium]|nr:hypothetical protein [Magnetococcales bacterium]
MEHKTTPLVGSFPLIVLGGFCIMGVTLNGIFDNPGELIRHDLVFGPIIATCRIVIPLFLTLGVVYWLATIKKCHTCGKILFWKKSNRT